MEWIFLIGVPVIVCLGGLVLRRRRERRLTATQHTVRCPVHDKPASVTVRSDGSASPSRRHVDVAACSLQPPTWSVAPARLAYFSDLCPPHPYLVEAGSAPVHSAEIACSRACLHVLNAAEAGASAEPVRCTSGMSDGMELVRQTQSPALTRIMWHHSS